MSLDPWSQPSDPVANILALRDRLASRTGFEPPPPFYVPRGLDAAARILFPGRQVVQWGEDDGRPDSVQVRAIRMRAARAVQRELGGESDGMRFMGRPQE